jgi:citrate synthase
MDGDREKALYVGAREAAAELGVKLPTLYAYVSRGWIRSESVGGKSRARRYRVEDVRRLKERAEGRRDPGKVAEGALDWGMPVMESRIALISDGRLYYRGRDAVALASRGSIEEVAALIWTGDPANAPDLFGVQSRHRPPRRALPNLTPFEGFGTLLPLAAAEDPASYDLRPFPVAKTGARILRLMADSAGVGDGHTGASVADTLRRGWVPGNPEAAALLGAAMVLCADHELNVSAFTARCVASSGATPYAVVAAGLAALSGVRHGGQVELVEALLGEAERAGSVRNVFVGRLKRGEKIPGFGHSLYPDGDPRGAELLRLTAAAYPRAAAVALASATAAEALDLLGERPTVDLGLAVLARALGLPPGGAVALFALGRTVGWIGHAIEQYEGGSLIRPRARYVGEPPHDLA